jgi:ubiquinone/menaquinone biosynthesis C-methylase UbiE
VNKDYIYEGAFETINLFSSARKIGWKKALSILTNVYLKEYILNPRRLCFTHLLNIKKGSKILDLGAGWGSISLPLAKGFFNAKIYSFDKTLESLLFLKTVKEQEELHNLKIVHGDATDIPFYDDFFDHVLMIGVLEYLGVSCDHKNPQDAQLQALKEIYRTLKNGGTLLMGIENRIGYQYFLGQIDHSGLKYTSLMPRFVANFYCNARIGKPYRVYTYTEFGYRKLLKSAGFRQIKTYIAFRTYRTPIFITDSTSVKNMIGHIPPKNKKHLTLIKMARLLPNAMLKIFAPNFFFHVAK